MRALVTVLFFVVAVPSLTACEIRTSQGVGGSCKDDGDCNGSLRCSLGGPGGYCTTQCTPASCPSGSTCVQTAGTQICEANCKAASDCRSGYRCYSLVGGGGVCDI